MLLPTTGTHLYNRKEVSFTDIHLFSHFLTFSMAFITRLMSSLALARVSERNALEPNTLLFEVAIAGDECLCDISLLSLCEGPFGFFRNSIESEVFIE